MSRYARLGLGLIAALAIGGCSNSEPDAPQPTAPTSAETPSTPAREPAAANEPAGADAPIAENQPAEGSPTVLGAIGRAVAGAVGVSENDGPGEAPAYRPPQ